jgi:hypothetical protein
VIPEIVKTVLKKAAAVVAILLGIGAILGGGVYVLDGLIIQDGPAKAAELSEIDTGDGIVVSGEAKPTDEDLVRTKYQNEEALAYAWTRSDYAPLTGRASDYLRIKEGKNATDFYVVDDTGRIYIESGGFNPEFGYREIPLDRGGKDKFREGYIEPGDEVLVEGVVEEGGNGNKYLSDVTIHRADEDVEEQKYTDALFLFFGGLIFIWAGWGSMRD